jgi:ABC-2 type transport system ATP-binding protein
MLSVDQVRKVYGSRAAADAISFEVRRGEILGFLGPNGAGKTTTLRMILGITRPDAGTVRVEGGALDPRRLGYLPEERGVYPDARVEDMVTYLGTLRGLGWNEARARAGRWLERLALTERRRDRVETLSKGNQQKVQIAGALVHDPDLVILDEPFSGLDPLNQELFLGVIAEQRSRGAAVLLSAHQLDLVERLCDRFFLISRGRQLLAGTLAELRRTAVGGADRVVAFEVAGAPDPTGWDALGRSVGASVLALSDQGSASRAELALHATTALSRLLAAVAERFEVREIESRPLRLHEIYVRALGEDLAVEGVA